MNHTRFSLGIVKIRPLLIRPHDLVARGLVEKLTGPVVFMMNEKEQYRRSSVEQLCCQLKALIAGNEITDDQRLVPAVSKLYVGPKPWATIIEAILKGRLPVRLASNVASGVLEGMAMNEVDLHAIVAKAPTPIAADDDGATNYVEAAAYFGVTKAAFCDLTAIGLLPAFDRINLRLRRGDLDAFAKKYFFTAEIARLLGTTPRNARKALDAKGIEPVASVGGGKTQVWKIDEVKAFFEKESSRGTSRPSKRK